MQLLTASEVADLLRVPTSWVYLAAREGSLPSIRMGRYVRFDHRDVDEWIEGRRRERDRPGVRQRP